MQLTDIVHEAHAEGDRMVLQVEVGEEQPIRITVPGEQGLAFAAEVLSDFILCGRESLQELQTAVGRSDREALSRAAHKLKGASANLHIESVTELAADLESRCKSQEPRGVHRHVENLAVELERSIQKLRA